MYKHLILQASWHLTCFDSPQNPKELFDLRHASLQNVIEHIFGILKRKFRILLSVSPELPKSTQIQLVLALAAIHNFICLNRENNNPTEDEFDVDFVAEDGFGQLIHPQPDTEEVFEMTGFSYLSENNLHMGITAEETTTADEQQDEIAEHMWADYQQVLANRACGAVDTEGMDLDE
jgi:hypothetical protein